MMVDTPFLSVIVPAHQGAFVLPRSLGALAASDLARERWELIVVDDASRDGTGAIAAQWADRVRTLTGGPHGPAYARNRGVEISTGPWLVFIDADVVVHQDTLRRFVETIEPDPSIGAVFGAYDEAPPAPGFLSRYRNLLHRFVHLRDAGETDTFWAGCGAIRRTAFEAVGGFAEDRYTRPQIEDIELGYRLRDGGYRILIDPAIQGTHLKHWTFLKSLRTDLFDRGIPWVRLLLERRSLASQRSLNFSWSERVKAFLVGLVLVLFLLGGLLRQPLPALIASLLLLGVLLSNLSLFSWFARRRGPLFALGVVPLNLLYYVLSGLSVAAGITLHVLGGQPKAIREQQVPGQPVPDPNSHHRGSPDVTTNGAELKSNLTAAFLPIHKLAFGVAIGVVAGLVVFGMTAMALLGGIDPFDLALLAQYFSGYTVSWTGAVIGTAWAGFTGFIMGWFWAFSRNFVLAFRLLILRSRAEMRQTRDFLDHI